MQDLLAMGGGGGGGGRIFTGDRRLRPLPNQAMKCPRCDSLNTKFCYYNNYNLSQPRHFCKSCRRYWTKGGVLRNVPVGGGCRKNKRSKPKPSQDPHKERKSTSHSSSESSSLTATTTTTTMTTEAASSAPSTNSTPALLNFHDSRLFISQNYNLNPNFEPSMLDTLEQPSDVGIYPESGTFTGLMTASNPALLGFNFSNASPFRLHHQQQVTHQPHDMEMQEVTAGFVDQTVPTTQHQQLKMTNMIEEMKINQELMTGFVDQTVPVELAGMQNSAGNGEGLTELDWPSSGDQGLYELASSVDQGYWNQNQWADNDHPLYLP